MHMTTGILLVSILLTAVMIYMTFQDEIDNIFTKEHK